MHMTMICTMICSKKTGTRMRTSLAIFVTCVFVLMNAGCGRDADSPAGEAGSLSAGRDNGAFTYEIPQHLEMAEEFTAKPGWETEEFAVAAANPLATDAGYQVLRAGGSAIDAAVAIQMVLTLVEPQSSGIGGGAFVMHWDGSRVSAFNGRETAPARAGEDLFLDREGNTIPFSEAVHSGLSVGVPGTLAVLRQAHEKYGRLSWAQLFEPAIQLAEQGFAISPRLHRQLQNDRRLRDDDIALALYYDEEGDAHPVGYQLRIPRWLRYCAVWPVRAFPRFTRDRWPQTSSTGSACIRVPAPCAATISHPIPLRTSKRIPSAPPGGSTRSAASRRHPPDTCP